MERTKILEKVALACKEVFEYGGQIDETINLITDLGCDSLKMLIFVNEIEDSFSISLQLDESKNMKTVGDVCDVVAKYIG